MRPTVLLALSLLVGCGAGTATITEPGQDPGTETDPGTDPGDDPGDDRDTDPATSPWEGTWDGIIVVEATGDESIMADCAGSLLVEIDAQGSVDGAGRCDTQSGPYSADLIGSISDEGLLEAELIMGTQIGELSLDVDGRGAQSSIGASFEDSFRFNGGIGQSVIRVSGDISLRPAR